MYDLEAIGIREYQLPKTCPNSVKKDDFASNWRYYILDVNIWLMLYELIC